MGKEEMTAEAMSADEVSPNGAVAGKEDGSGLLSREELIAELEKTREEAQVNYDKLLRLAAEFENQKKRLQREKDQSLHYAEESILKEVLPFIDNLERALAQDRAGKDFGTQLLEGVEMTLKGLITTLEKYGLQAISSHGKPFDPNFHEALAMEASKEIPEQMVLQEFEKGYLFKDKLLRAAKVVVSKGDTE
ncbi:MAG: nucleotide exchange factor GrpE [Proteobacteria bacterium]|nr:nucleotide exchange factor GrpE [Pseudomonadota bacterium]MBU1688021.1 nucleotide exchange factor GrpE [Pseudomonadota bacterium]